MKYVFQRIPILLGGVSIGIAVFISFFIFFDSVKLPYWQYFSYLNIARPLILSVLFPSLFIVFLWMILQIAFKKYGSLGLTTIGFALSLFASLIGCGSLIAFTLILGDYEFRADAHLDEHTYYVSSAWKPGIGSVYLSSFWLNQCDKSGMNCVEIYEQKYRKIPQSEYRAMNVHLIPDFATNTLALEINGEVVYTYQP